MEECPRLEREGPLLAGASQNIHRSIALNLD
jgi:hypothetical protein